MIFMSQEKEFSDTSKKNSSRWQERGGDGGWGRGRGQGRGQGQGQNGGGCQGCGNNEQCQSHEGLRLWKDCPSNRNGSLWRWLWWKRPRPWWSTIWSTAIIYTQQYQHLPAPPPAGQDSLPPRPVALVTVGPAEAHYINQFSGQAQSVSGVSYMTSPTPTPTQPNEFYMASDGKFYCKWNAVDSRPTTLNVDQWFETGVNDHVRHETYLPATARMLNESKKEVHHFQFHAQRFFTFCSKSQ